MGNIVDKLVSQIDHQALIDAMSPYADNGQPKVGIFWYDVANRALFGVEKDDAEKYIRSQGYGTLGKLHKTYWQKQHQRAVAKGNCASIFYYELNYTRIPRGRVFVRPDGSCFVAAGSWFGGIVSGEKILDPAHLRELIADEFNLPDNFEFQYDPHWDVGRGWSEEGQW